MCPTAKLQTSGVRNGSSPNCANIPISAGIVTAVSSMSLIHSLERLLPVAHGVLVSLISFPPAPVPGRSFLLLFLIVLRKSLRFVRRCWNSGRTSSGVPCSPLSILSLLRGAGSRETVWGHLQFGIIEGVCLIFPFLSILVGSPLVSYRSRFPGGYLLNPPT